MSSLLESQLAILLRKAACARRAGEFSPAACSFGPQRRAIESTAKRKVLRCGRRSGKTVGIAIKLLMAALEEPCVPVLYITLTRENAREIIWGDLQRLNEEYQLGFVEHISRLEFVSPKGGVIQLRGAHTEKEIAKYRGKKFKLVIIDEAQSFPDRVLKPLLQDVIGPTLTDYQGELWLAGTRPALRGGHFSRCYEKGDLAAAWEPHSWTVLENERFPARMAGVDVQKILDDVCKENGWSQSHPTFQREYLDRDIEDPESLLFEYDKIRNGYTNLPPGEWSFVLSLDLGYEDNMALACLGWRKHDAHVYLVDEWSDNHVDITDSACKLHQFVETYHPQSMVIDQGALGKLVAVEMRRRHGLPLKPAEKSQKGAHIKLLNTELRKGMLLAKTDSVFAEECALVRKDPKAAMDGKLQELTRAAGGFHGNMTDAVLYGWRECKAFFERPETAKDPLYVAPNPTLAAAIAEQRRNAHRDPLDAFFGD